jgi:cell shape-determining protein MreC
MQFLGMHKFHDLVKQTLMYAVVFLMIVLIERVGWAGTFRGGALRLFQPFELFGMNVLYNLEFPVRWIEGNRVKAEEVRTLKRSYAEALAKLSELETVKRENETLRALIEKEGSRVEKKLLAAPIISYSLTAIAKGSDAGVTEGALVYVGDTLVGRVTQVSQSQSLVTLFSHPESAQILVQTESGVQGLLVGTGKQLDVTQLPTQSTISVGERITTVGQPGIPPGQLVGVVAAVSQGQTAPMQTAIVDELTSFYTASLVEIK